MGCRATWCVEERERPHPHRGESGARGRHQGVDAPRLSTRSDSRSCTRSSVWVGGVGVGARGALDARVQPGRARGAGTCPCPREVRAHAHQAGHRDAGVGAPGRSGPAGADRVGAAHRPAALPARIEGSRLRDSGTGRGRVRAPAAARRTHRSTAVRGRSHRRHHRLLGGRAARGRGTPDLVRRWSARPRPGAASTARRMAGHAQRSERGGRGVERGEARPARRRTGT